jgi:hypothetical protein
MSDPPLLTELTGDHQCLHEFIATARAKLNSNICATPETKEAG